MNNINEKFINLLNQGFDHHINNRLDDAEKIYKYLITINNKNHDALRLLGTLYAAQKKTRKAIHFLKSSIEIEPNNYYAHLNLGTAYGVLEDDQNFLYHLNQSLRIDQDKFEANETLGKFFFIKNNFSKALYFFENAFLKKTENFDIQNYILICKLGLANWKHYNSDIEKVLDNLNKKFISFPPFYFLYISQNPQEQKINFELHIKEYLKYSSRLSNKNFSYKKKKINLGYFSADFNNSAVGNLIYRLFKHHDKEDFNIYGFSFVELKNQKDICAEKIYKTIKVIDISQKSYEQIEKICSDLEINIAIDLMGKTRGARPEIFYKRVAPIQINWLGYPGTVGPNLSDYIIADKKTIPNDCQNFYFEKIIYLPNSFLISNDEEIISDKKFSRSELGLPEKGFVFSGYNNIFKINPKMFDVWTNILKKVDDSVLWLIETDNNMKINLINEAKKRNINSNRLIFGKKMIKKDEHFSRIKNTDLFLDTFPYNAHSTALDFLWAEIPILTLCGRTFPSRVGYSLLSALELEDELTCFNFKEYENKAIMLANNKIYLKKIKEKLIKNKKEKYLFNNKLFTENLEKAYKKIYENYYNQIPIDHINI